LTERTVGYPSGPRPLCRPQRPGRGRMHRHRLLPYRFPEVAGRSSISSCYGPLALRQDSSGLRHLSSHETPDTLRQRPRGVHCGQGGEDRLDENLRAKRTTRKPRDPGSAEEVKLTYVVMVVWERDGRPPPMEERAAIPRVRQHLSTCPACPEPTALQELRPYETLACARSPTVVKLGTSGSGL